MEAEILKMLGTLRKGKVIDAGFRDVRVLRPRPGHQRSSGISAGPLCQEPEPGRRDQGDAQIQRRSAESQAPHGAEGGDNSP